MNTYEALVIFKPASEGGENQEMPTRVFENLVRQQKGKLLHVDRVGRKRLAYEMKKVRDAQIAVFVFQMNPASVDPFRKNCQITDEILRLSMVRFDHFDSNNIQSTTSTVTAKELKERDMARSNARQARGRRDRGDRGDRGGERNHHHHEGRGERAEVSAGASED